MAATNEKGRPISGGPAVSKSRKDLEQHFEDTGKPWQCLSSGRWNPLSKKCRIGNYTWCVNLQCFSGSALKGLHWSNQTGHFIATNTAQIMYYHSLRFLLSGLSCSVTTEESCNQRSALVTCIYGKARS